MAVRHGVNQMPSPPFPDPDDPMLAFLLNQAEKQLAEAEDVRKVMLHLAVTAWFEGHLAAVGDEHRPDGLSAADRRSTRGALIETLTPGQRRRALRKMESDDAGWVKFAPGYYLHRDGEYGVSRADRHWYPYRIVDGDQARDMLGWFVPGAFAALKAEFKDAGLLQDDQGS